MVLSNSKLKRKKREEAVLNPPPDSSATPSVANDVKAESPALASAKKKKKKPKSKAVNGDAEEVAAGSGAVPEGDAVEGERVQQPKKKKSKAAPIVEEAVVAAEEAAGVSTENGADGAAPVQDGEPKAKIRKKPRWEVDADGKRVKPQRAGGEAEGEGHPNGAKAAASPSKGAENDDVQNGAAAVPDAVNDGDRMHQGDEPWLQSKRKEKKKKKKQTDKWGKKIEEAEAVAVDNEEAPQVASSTEEKVDPKKVMVGGMPYYISEDDIHEYFQECGTIAELDCMTFPDTGKFKGIAFITFRTEEAAKRALAMDGADMGGRYLKIDMCKIRPKEPAKKSAFKEPPKKYEGCLSAYIGNLAWDITEKELRKFFKGCKIESIRFAEDKATGEFKGFGHVDFADDESLEAAMKLDQMPVLDRPLKIAYSVPQKNKAVEARPGQGGDRKKGCYNCGEDGHMSYNCPSKL